MRITQDWTAARVLGKHRVGLVHDGSALPVGAPPALAKILAAVVLFAVAFAFVEAAVVVYLRVVYEPIREPFHPGIPPGDLFPLLRLDQLESAGPIAARLLRVELVREAATLVMLAAVGLAVGRNPRQAIAAFLVAFGVWDIAFYGFLKVLIDWPASWQTWDLLFLLPVPWAAPVWAPMAVALSMIVSGAILLRREFCGRLLRLSATDWAAVIAGGLTIVVAFCWDHRNLMAGGQPNPFHWPLLVLGEVVGVAGFVRGWRRSVVTVG
jgi:hypothetical protein